jgi:hypothetical protein
MRSIQARFNQSRIVKEREFWGDYLHLAKAVEGQCFTRDSIARIFKKLISKDEYCLSEKKGLIDYLGYISNQ